MKKTLFFVLVLSISIFSTSCGDTDTGDSGNTGDTGNTGNTGDTGDTGNTGNTGDSGNTGNTGESCVEGEKRCYPKNIELDPDPGDSGNTGDSGYTFDESATCVEIIGCMLEYCKSYSTDCHQACIDSGTESAQSNYSTFNKCAVQNECDLWYGWPEFYSCITENCPEEAELCGYEISDSDDEIADTDTIDILSDQDTSDLNNEINNNKIAIFEMNEEEVYVEICENGKWIFLETCYDNACRNGKCLYYPDRKPNIYIYPPVETQVQVSIDFPEGGHVTVSEPEYYNGWNVTVTPEGIIDDEYTFLFYESVQPDLWQKNNGWVVETETLEDFFVTTLENYGFKGNEITDFIEWWVPRLVDFPYYIIYPQIATDIEILNVLNILPAPESILRFRFYISGSDSPFHKIDIPKAPEPFERNGFTVTEWGVILGSPVN